MNMLLRTCVLFISAALIFASTSLALAETLPHEPAAEPYFRPLRSDYVRSWHLFNDSSVDGILSPADTHAASFNNWWTPVSGHSLNHMKDRLGLGAGDDRIAAPMNFATAGLAGDHPDKYNSDYNYWLPRSENAIHFYMLYAQYDNADWSTLEYGSTQVSQEIHAHRSMQRNGYSMGWLTNDFRDDSGVYTEDQTPTGSVKMDVLVHNGERTQTLDGWGTSRSNPQVAAAGDMDYLTSRDAQSAGEWHPPQFDEATQSYSWSENQQRMEANGVDSAGLTTLVNSLELREVNPLTMSGQEAVQSGRTPQALIDAGVTDHTGASPYEYQDAFVERSTYVAASTDGQMISGLSGWSDYDPAVNELWGDQQVIRIDISADTFASDEGKIDEIVFFDFGDSTPGATGTQQTAPRMIVLGIDTGRSVADGQIFLKDPDTGLSVLYFPENRIYIAAVPEPGTLVLLACGSLAAIVRRRRRR